jgi:hypothetical protein
VLGRNGEIARQGLHLLLRRDIEQDAPAQDGRYRVNRPVIHAAAIRLKILYLRTSEQLPPTREVIQRIHMGAQDLGSPRVSS